MIMPKSSNTARRSAARELANHQGINHSTAVRRIDTLRAVTFADDEFVTGSRVGDFPSEQHLCVARRDGHVEVRSTALAGTRLFVTTAIRLTEYQWDLYQFGVREGAPQGWPFDVDINADKQWVYRNIEDPDSNTLTSDGKAFLLLQDGIHRGEFGGPNHGVSEGLHSGRGLMPALDFLRLRIRSVLFRGGQLTDNRKAILDTMGEQDLERAQGLVRPYVISLADHAHTGTPSPALARAAAALFDE
jgi:hypothetical protein